MTPTTIAIDPKIRDRLKKHGHAGETYNDILDRLMGLADMQGFFEDARRIMEAPDSEEWATLEEWDAMEGWDPSSWK